MRKFISGLILGAGASQRLGPPKQLLPFRGTTMLGWVVDQANRPPDLTKSSWFSVVQQMKYASGWISVRHSVVENPVFAEGCSSSYRAGSEHWIRDSEAIMIILGDQPGITPEIIDTLADEWRGDEAPIALCSYRGRKGHPMIFAQSMFEQLKTCTATKPRGSWSMQTADRGPGGSLRSSLP